MLSEEVKRYRELSGDNNPNTPISRIGGYLDGYEKAMEKEPCDYEVRQKMYYYLNGVADGLHESRRDTIDTLDKIRAEIELLSNANPSYWHSGDMVEREEVLDIIDKYKAESEE